jgi:hypothetical protein
MRSLDNIIYIRDVIHNNTIVDIADPNDALRIEDDAGEQNTLYSNALIDPATGASIDLGQVQDSTSSDDEVDNEQ